MPFANRFPPMVALGILGFLGFLGSILYLNLFILCPRCGMKLGNAGFMSQGWFSQKSKINFCPNCGTDFNKSS